MSPFLPQETIRRQRDGERLPADEIAAFVRGIASGTVSDAQCAAFAMAVCWRGMDTAACVALTLAMRDSGERLAWPVKAVPGHGLPELRGPVVDKHSTGGIGDSVSLLLGPMLAACGCHVPMISGRGLGHTGGTLDKLEAISGYSVQPDAARFERTVREVGVAIVGAGDRLAPADRRLYAVRDVTATVDSVPLITASILAKKLAAGLGALVLDVKVGNGAFMRDAAQARALAQSLVDVACGAGLPTLALLTDMDQPLAPCAGNALEMRLAIDLLRGDVVGGPAASARLLEVTLALGAALLVQARLAVDAAAARRRLQRSLDDGSAAERLARMVAALGGPADLLEQPARHLASAPVRRDVRWPAAARGLAVTGIDTRALGLAVIGLGGGRVRGDDRVDPAVGLAALLPLGATDGGATPLAVVHAANEADAAAAAKAVLAAYRFGAACEPASGAGGCVIGRVESSVLSVPPVPAVPPVPPVPAVPSIFGMPSAGPGVDRPETTSIQPRPSP